MLRAEDRREIFEIVGAYVIFKLKAQTEGEINLLRRMMDLPETEKTAAVEEQVQQRATELYLKARAAALEGGDPWAVISGIGKEDRGRDGSPSQ